MRLPRVLAKRLRAGTGLPNLHSAKRCFLQSNTKPRPNCGREQRKKICPNISNISRAKLVLCKKVGKCKKTMASAMLQLSPDSHCAP